MPFNRMMVQLRCAQECGRTAQSFLTTEGSASSLCRSDRREATGKITEINNGSGHYQPSEESLKEAARLLQDRGWLAESCKFKKHVQGDGFVEITI